MFRCALLCLAFSAVVFGGQDYRLDLPVNGVSADDLTGKPVSFPIPGDQVTVVMFISTQCPVSNGYNERMIALHRDYASKGVRFIFLNANRNESAAEVEKHERDNEFPFPVYKDTNNRMADHFGAEVTPEAYVIDRTGILRYHGSIDDSPGNEARISVRPLRAAIDAVLSGGAVPKKEAKAMGCTIKRVRGGS